MRRGTYNKPVPPPMAHMGSTFVFKSKQLQVRTWCLVMLHDATEEEEQQALLQLQQHHHASRGGGFVGGGGVGSALVALSRSSSTEFGGMSALSVGGSMGGRHTQIPPAPFSRRTRRSREPPEARETPTRRARRAPAAALRGCGPSHLPAARRRTLDQEPAAGAAARASGRAARGRAPSASRLASEEEGEAAGGGGRPSLGRAARGAGADDSRCTACSQLTFELNLPGATAPAPAPLSQSARGNAPPMELRGTGAGSLSARERYVSPRATAVAQRMHAKTAQPPLVLSAAPAFARPFNRALGAKGKGGKNQSPRREWSGMPGGGSGLPSEPVRQSTASCTTALFTV